jgi:hypothetical protein
MNADDFSYWFISVFLGLAGIIYLTAGRYLGDLKCSFWLELRNPAIAERLRPVLDRREKLEGLGRKPMLLIGGCYLLFGLLCGFRFVSPALAYALACATSALILAWVFAQVRNRSQRRAASLAPRRQSGVVPPLAYAGALVASALPLLFVVNPELRIPAVIVSLSGLVIIVAAWYTAGMAAVLVGDDVDYELYVDERIRRSRVAAMLTFAYAVVPVFVAVVTRNAVTIPTYDYAFYASMILIFAFLLWYGIDFRRGRAPQTNGT